MSQEQKQQIIDLVEAHEAAHIEYQRTLKADITRLEGELANAQAPLQQKLDEQTALRVQAEESAAIAQRRVGELVTQLDDTLDNLAAAEKKYADHMATEHKPPTLFGFWAGNVGANGVRASYDKVASYLGTPGVYRMFYPGAPQANFVGSNADFGPPVVVSFKLKPQEVVAGKHDTYLRAWFASIPEDRKVFWSYFHEPENDIEAGAFTAAEYRAAWDHILNLAPKRETLVPTLILMRYTLSIPTRRTVAWYVSEGLKTAGNGVLCWDSYLTGTLTVKQVVADPAAVSASFGLGFAIGETSTPTAAKMESFVRELVPAARAAGAVFVSWFETNKAGQDVNEANWCMSQSPAAVAAWKSLTAPTN